MEIKFITKFKDRGALLEQLAIASYTWHKAESESLGTFYDRCELCNYVSWLAKKAIEEKVEDYTSVPRLILFFK